MSNTENRDLLVPVIPCLTQLTTVRYHGGGFSRLYHGTDHRADRAFVAAVMSLTQLEWIQLEWVDLGDDGVEGTDVMTRLRMVELGPFVHMTATRWDRFVSSLFTLPQSVSVVLHQTDIDEGTVKRIQTSPRVTVTRDRYFYEFTTVPSQEK